MDELKPCPWCGNKSEVIQTKCISNGFVGYRVWHSSFGCLMEGMQTRIMDTPGEAIEAWNRRAEE